MHTHAHPYIHMHTPPTRTLCLCVVHVHVLFTQFDMLNIVWNMPPIFSEGTTGIDTLLQEIVKQLHSREVVVKKCGNSHQQEALLVLLQPWPPGLSLVICPSQCKLRNRIEIAYVAIDTVRSNPNLKSSSDWFHCFSDDRPLNGTIASSTAFSL